MPQSVIEHLNSMSRAPKMKMKTDPTFSMSHPGGAMKEYHEDPAEEQSYQMEPIRTVTNEQVRTRDLRSEDTIQRNDEEVVIQEADEAVFPSEPSMELPTSDHPAQGPAVQHPLVPETVIPSEEPIVFSEQPPTTATTQQPTQAHRYSLRERRAQPGRWNQKASKNEYGLHITATKAIKSHGKEAITAMLLEIQQMLKKEVWKPVDVGKLTPLQRKSIIITSMFLKEKQKPDGSFDKLKARLVAGGHMQDRSVYEDISSPTVSWTSVCMLLNIAAYEERIVCTADFTGAYLNASMRKDGVRVRVRLNQLQSALLVSLDPTYGEFVCQDGTIVVELEKAMYGCIESAQLWYDTLKETLVNIGFKANREDPCVFNLVKDGTQ